MSTPAASTGAATTARATDTRWPAILCWLAVALEGFDLVVLGAVIPELLATNAIGFTPEAATLVATLSLVGVGLGAAAVGPIADRFGRRYTIIFCVLFFSIFTILVAFSPNVALFTTFRFIAGLALGAVMPGCLAYISEHNKSGKTGKATTLTMTGYHAGAVAISLLAVFYSHNWHLLFIAGGVAGLVLVPLLWWKLPESQEFVEAQSSTTAAPKTGMAGLFVGRFKLVTIGVWAASFMGLLLVYGLNTWLPKIMADAGYEVSDSLVMLFVLNLGAVVGLVIAGWLADKHGTKPIVLMWFLLAAVFLAALSIPMTSQILLNIAVFITGVFVFSAQVLVYAFVSAIYPPTARGTALGMASAVGRLGAIVGPFITGTLVTAGIAYPWGFYLFAVVAVFGFAAMAIVPKVVSAAGR
ncbi:MAG: MFS transporter [Brevibacterium aurantiacum]|uniref:Sugar phosphate permease n=3 Tax=Brevibacterium aurantiacum TaxID=273384 RepID=A0A2H1IET5_BREAU|nr:aromatic acid/H+ symport family MFS transporter [Brevibacterium aurantiacum]MDN5593899.1 aromatic acid/H+ symport family MFS transporter [Brevibacterium sp.]MDN5607318.1 aromatic acid/H+ symport family MFS transporter [Brevibacterium sp.]PCC56171.1 MFS transporter [Brevibacterium aurantiacum]RCS97136.1 MFS transporter [Brevibacterium aurantiacum]SMX73729.1 Sugar phosphate permease [Brevibacterium aurantiacum]